MLMVSEWEVNFLLADGTATFGGLYSIAFPPEGTVSSSAFS